MNAINSLLTSILTTALLSAQTNWVQQQLPANSNILLNIDFSYYNTGITSGWTWGVPEITGVAFYTSDGGDLWEISTLPDSTRAVINAKMFSSSRGIAAAAYNYFTNSDENYKDYLSELFEKKDYLKLPNALIGDMAGSQTGGLILKTVDAGATWNTISVLPDSFTYLNGAFFIDENIGLVITHTDSLFYILKTSNGGINWEAKFTFPPNSGSTSITFSSSLNGVAVGYNISTVEQGLIVTTNDGGENWTYQFIPLAGNLPAATFSDENTFYAAGQNFQNTYVFKSTDAGQSWITTSFQSTELFLGGINFLSGTNSGFVFGNTLSFSDIFCDKTYDGGNTWSAPEFISSFPNYLLIGSKILDENVVYLSGGDVTSQGLVLKTSNAALPVELDLQKPPTEFALEQNFPNPFNPTTKIVYSVPQTAYVSIKVYDLLGNEIETLIGVEKSPGLYEIIWDAENIPSGVYLYSLQAGDSKISKKMILLR